MQRRILLATLVIALALPATALAAGGGDGSFNGARVFRHLLNLAIFIGVIAYFVKTPLADFLEFRRTEIKEGLDNAFDAKASAEDRYTELQSRLDGLETELGEMMSRVAADGEREHQRLVTSGEEAARQVDAATTRAIDEEGPRPAADLRAEAIDLAMAKAGELLASSVGDADQKRLSEGYLTTLQERAQP